MQTTELSINYVMCLISHIGFLTLKRCCEQTPSWVPTSCFMSNITNYISCVTYYSVMSISSVEVSNTSFNCTSLGCDITFSNITTSRKMSSRHVLPLRRFLMYLAATVSFVSLCTNFLTTANFPLEKINKIHLKTYNKRWPNVYY